MVDDDANESEMHKNQLIEGLIDAVSLSSFLPISFLAFATFSSEVAPSHSFPSPLSFGPIFLQRPPPTTNNSTPASSSHSSPLSDDENESSDQDPTPRRRRPSLASNDTAGPSRLRAHIPVRTRSHDEASGNEAGGEETEWEGSVGDAAVVGSGGRRGVGRRTVSGPIAVAAGGDKRALRGRSQSLGGGGGGSVATVKAVMERKARFGDVESPAGLNLK